MTFSELGLSEEILSAINKLGFTEPTAIQREAIPYLLSDSSDFIGLAQTGTGKTAAFGLPLIDSVDSSVKATSGLIICPTRELCLQISKDLEAFSSKKGKFNVVPVYGGSSIDVQINKIRRGAHVIVATPGRMVDLLKRRALKIDRVQTVVLDEADEMLNMGFKEDLDFILSATPEQKNVWLFSATMPKEVRRIASNYMKDPKEVTVGAKNTSAENITHAYFVVKERDRYPALKRILDSHPDIYGLVFCRTRRETAKVADGLEKDGYSSIALHGDLSQAQRDSAMKKFRDKTIQILVATDVAARGIDVDEITHVINYNLPDDVENYTHRSGRTARAGKSGESLVLINSKEKGKIRQIEKITQATFELREVPSPTNIVEKQLIALVDRVIETEINEEELDKFIPLLNEKFAGLSADDIILKFLSLEFNKHLDYYKNAGDLNQKASDSHDDRGDRRGRNNRNLKGDRGVRMFMSLGKRDNMNAGALIRVVCEEAGIESSAIGRVDLNNNFSHFDIQPEFSEHVAKKMNTFTYEGKSGKVEIAAEGAKDHSKKGRGRKSSSDSNYRSGGGKKRRPAKRKR